MSVCRRPGCVSDAVEDGLCRIHDSGAGVSCSACRGTGYIRSCFVDKVLVKDPCDRCGGTGLRDQRRSKRVPHEEIQPVDRRGLITLASNE
jgi:hypothetical protein